MTNEFRELANDPTHPGNKEYVAANLLALLDALRPHGFDTGDWFGQLWMWARRSKGDQRPNSDFADKLPQAPEFDPDWVVKPGETLREWIEENHLTVRSTATICGRMEPERLQRIIDGKQRIGVTTACKLQAGTGIPASLWLNLERAYRAGLRAGKKEF